VHEIVQKSFIVTKLDMVRNCTEYTEYISRKRPKYYVLSNKIANTLTACHKIEL